MSRRGMVLAKAGVWTAALVPALVLGTGFVRDTLGANPVEAILHRTGWWGLVLLLASLAITPLRRLTGWHRLIRFRRLVGLFAFFYLTLHFAIYAVLDQGLAWGFIAEDLTERPFIYVGFTAWLILLALAVTSTRGWIRRLGRAWQRLHRLVYVAALLGGVHFLWKVKADTLEPLVFLTVYALLMAARLRPRRWRGGRPARPAGGRAGAPRPAERAGA